jgi:hypothetical protein
MEVGQKRKRSPRRLKKEKAKENTIPLSQSNIVHLDSTANDKILTFLGADRTSDLLSFDELNQEQRKTNAPILRAIAKNRHILSFFSENASGIYDFLKNNTFFDKNGEIICIDFKSMDSTTIKPQRPQKQATFENTEEFKEDETKGKQFFNEENRKNETTRIYEYRESLRRRVKAFF